MARYSRRSVVQASAAGVAMTAVPFSKWLGEEAYAATRVRYNAYSTEGKKMLKKYAKAVAIMKQKAAGDATGWTFQWYTHYVRGDSTKSAEVKKLPIDQRPLANDMWNTCQNHAGQTTEDMFLPWHRMFVFYFERIVRGVLEDPDWTLPYWNYNDTNEAALPPEFLNPANTSNPLWSKNRNSGPNSGQKLTGLNLDALKKTNYSSFCSTLDFGLHGDVHVGVGNRSGMGNVPWAANDPIFWLHHCNIDRLWASWNAGGYTNPTSPSWTDQTFVFANARGNKVVADVGSFTAIGPLQYSYERLEPVTVTSFASPLLSRALSGPPLLLTAPGPVDLHARPVTVELEPPAGKAAFSLQQHVRRLASPKRVFLVVGGLETKGAPGVVYNVYLDLKEGDRAAEARRVGEINFFAADMPPGGREMKHKPGLVFDVTDIVKKDAAAGRLGETLAVTISPVGTPAKDAQPVVGEIAFIEE